MIKHNTHRKSVTNHIKGGIFIHCSDTKMINTLKRFNNQNIASEKTIDIHSGLFLNGIRIYFEEIQPFKTITLHIPKTMELSPRETVYNIQGLETGDVKVYEASCPMLEMQCIAYNSLDVTAFDSLFTNTKERVFIINEWIKPLEQKKLVICGFNSFTASFRQLDPEKNMFIYICCIQARDTLLQINFICENYLSDNYSGLIDAMLDSISI